jgi:hypothetical protein
MVLVGVAYACDVREREGRDVVFGERKFKKKHNSFKYYVLIVLLHLNLMAIMYSSK